MLARCTLVWHANKVCQAQYESGVQGGILKRPADDESSWHGRVTGRQIACQESGARSGDDSSANTQAVYWRWRGALPFH